MLRDPCTRVLLGTWLITFPLDSILRSLQCTQLFLTGQLAYSTPTEPTCGLYCRLCWVDLICSFWERAHNLVCSTTEQGQYALTLGHDDLWLRASTTIDSFLQFRLPKFPHMAWVNPWYGFQALSKGATRWVQFAG